MTAFLLPICPAEHRPGSSESPKSRLGWESIDNPLFRLDEDTLKGSHYCHGYKFAVLSLTAKQPLPPPVDGDVSLPYDIANLKDYSIAVTGDVFRWVVDYAPQEVLNRVGEERPNATPTVLNQSRFLSVDTYLRACLPMRNTNWLRNFKA